MPALSVHRVERNTAAEIDRARQAEIQASLRYHAARPREVPARLAELDCEWDIERVIEAHTATVALGSLLLGTFVNRKFLLLTAAVASVSMLHVVQGWCPRVAILRRLGFRTRAEICEERCGLKMLGGEYRAFGEPAAGQFVAQTAEIHEAVEA